MHCGFAGGDTFILLLACELDDQDRVLGGQADENNKADLCQDIDRHAPYEQPCDRCEQAHRHDQDDRQRQLPAFVMRRQHQKHKKSGCPEDENGGGATLLLLISKISPFKRDAQWKNLTSKFFHAMQCCAGSDTRCCDPLHLSGGKEIVARHAVGNRPVPQLCDRADWHHLAGRVADLQAGNVLRRPPELAVGLDDDLVSSAEIVEVVDVLRTKINLQGAEYISRREADFFGFQATDIGVDRNPASNSVKTPAKSGSLFAASTRAFAARTSACEPSPPRSSSISLNPPALPRPCTGGGGMVTTWASLMIDKRVRRSAKTVFAVTLGSS